LNPDLPIKIGAGKPLTKVEPTPWREWRGDNEESRVMILKFMD
jgi:hypothetical protein